MSDAGTGLFAIVRCIAFESARYTADKVTELTSIYRSYNPV